MIELPCHDIIFKVDVKVRLDSSKVDFKQPFSRNTSTNAWFHCKAIKYNACHDLELDLKLNICQTY